MSKPHVWFESTTPVIGREEFEGKVSKSPQEPEFQTKVWDVVTDIGGMLIQKNEAYGNSALDPVRIFSKADPAEQIRVRIDDKLSRIQTDLEHDNEDAVKDLLGYLVLYTIAKESESA